jgi:putative endonuclease
MYRRPVSLVHVEDFDSLSAAIHREKQIKNWSSAKKEALIRGELEELHRLARRRKFRPPGSST